MKSILYFDERKVFSLSSQIFSGVTEYIIKESTTNSTESETQKGTIASGKVLAQAITSGGKDVEKRVMHDHAFSLFEKEIERQELVNNIGVNYDTENIGNILAKPFVRISAPARIFDVKKIVDIMDDFNGIGRALAYTQSKEAIDEISKKFDALIETTKDQTKLGSLKKQKTKAIEELVDIAAKGMHQDPMFMQALSRVVKFGFEESLEIHQAVGALRFTSLLDKLNLREDASSLSRKYGRLTKLNLMVFGTITNYPNSNSESLKPVDDATSSMKEALIKIANSMAVLEDNYSDVGKNEYMVDPLAIYVMLGQTPQLE